MVEVEKQPKTIVIPRYQPVFVEPNLKEYETQVLQMSVPIGDDDRMFDFSTATRNGGGGTSFVYNFSCLFTIRQKFVLISGGRNLRYQPSFSIDNISYITKDRTGKSIITLWQLFVYILSAICFVFFR